MEDPMVAQCGGGLSGYDTKHGKKLWDIDDVQTCSPVLVDGTLYLPHAYELQTGKPVQTQNAITSKDEQFVPQFPRACSMLSGSPNFLMSRSGSLGFYDLRQQSGYYHYPIVRASCWINMIPAGGVVMVPEGSSSCVCGYNYKTSLALVSADREYHYGISRIRKDGDIRRLHINFGAPGDRPDAQGDIWHAYPRPVAYGRPLARAKYGPKIGGGQLPIREKKSGYKTVSRNPDWLSIQNTDKSWLYSCGLQGPVDLLIQLGSQQTNRYRVTFHLSRLDTNLGEYDIYLQGTLVGSISEKSIPQRHAVTNSFDTTASDELSVQGIPEKDANPAVLRGLEIERLP
jgi:hypothetical protein